MGSIPIRSTNQFFVLQTKHKTTIKISYMNLFAKTVLFQFLKTDNGKKYLLAETERTQYLIPPGKKTEDEIFASLNIEGGYDYCNVVIIDEES